MGKTSNYTKTVMESLSKLADKVDASGSGTGGKADFYDVVSNSLARISENYNGSGGGGGTGGGALIVHSNDDTGALDKTWQEIKNAYDAGSVVMLQFDDGSEYITDYLHKIQSVKGTFSVIFGEFGKLDTYSYVTDSANGYPVFSE